MDKEKKRKIIKYSLIGFALLLFFIFTLFLLNYAKKQNYDIEVLSGVNYLKADLAYFYLKYNMYPLEIKNKKDILEKDFKDTCSRNLCLDDYIFKYINSLSIKYMPCKKEGENCSIEQGENPKSYRFVYNLR